jgi:hypothetical protein
MRSVEERMEVGGGWRLEVCGFGNIKGNKGMRACNCEIWRTTHAFADHNMFCPKY